MGLDFDGLGDILNPRKVETLDYCLSLIMISLEWAFFNGVFHWGGGGV